MKRELETLIRSIAEKLFGIDVSIVLTRPEQRFGDYATNVALQIAAKVGKNPKDIATELANGIRIGLPDKVASSEVAGAGFINLTLHDEYLLKMLKAGETKSLKDTVTVVEYSDPNPFKVLHAGHLYTSVVGDAIANLLELAGGKVYRVNFGGDVGLHVAKTLWAMEKELKGNALPQSLKDSPIADRASWMAKCYVEGSQAYEDEETAKQAITNLNKQVYEIHTNQDQDSYLAQIYWTCREWSYQYFQSFYEQIGSHFDKYYAESEVVDLGLSIVREQLDRGVYEQSDGAIIFDGEKYGLHKRVFINSKGLPTYEAKDVGLIFRKKRDYNFDSSVVITANEQEQYMAVVLKSIEQFAPELARDSKHLTHGIVKLKGGEKMSSRKGNFLRATDVLDVAREASKSLTDQDNEQAVLGAVKYAFLKNRIGGDIIYDPQESASLEGNSGPYLQYAHARAQSILAKKNSQPTAQMTKLEEAEHGLLCKISEYPEVIDRAVDELMPHYVCTYLYELAQVFNRFYENNRVIDDPRQAIRLVLLENYTNTLKNGLTLLNIPAPNHL